MEINRVVQKRYVIKSIDGGWYDLSNNSFRGYAFATKHYTRAEAINKLSELSAGLYQIEKIYIVL